jgi:IPT/TIG domain
MLRYLACLMGFFTIIAVLPVPVQASAQPAPIEKSGPVQEGSPKKERPAEARPSGQIQGQAQSLTAQTPVSQAGDKLGNSSTPNKPNPIFTWILAGGLLLLAFMVGLIAYQWSKTPQAKDDDKALEALRIIYGFWLIVAALLIALLVLVVTLTAIPPDGKASDIVAIAGTVTGLITTLTAAFFGIQQAGAGRSQAMTALGQSTRAGGAVVGKLDPSYGPHSGGTKVSITGNGLTGASGVNFGATQGTNFKFENDGLITVNSPPAQSKDNEVKVYVVFPSTSPPNSEVGTFYYYTIDPSHGPAAGGQRVTIIGSGLKDVSAVKFGDHDGTNLGLVAPGPGGRESRIVTAPGGTQGSDVPIKLVFPVETANKIFVVGTYHYD